jgi:hypothetical protein
MKYSEATIKELPLFSLPPAVRSSNPVSSFEAIEEHTKSGDRLADCQKILTVMEQMLAVGYFQRVTAWEICEASGLDHTMVCRRLPELVKFGKIKREMKMCSVVNRETLAYWIDR